MTRGRVARSSARPRLAGAALVLAVLAGCGGDATGGGEPAAPQGDGARTAYPQAAVATTPAPEAAVASTPAPEARAEVVFTGDLMLARSIGRLVLAEGPSAPWEGVAEVLAGADLRVGNLETTVGNAGAAEDKAYTFRAPAESVDALVAGGLDVLTLANNHAYDYGAAGLLETLRLVHEQGIRTVGAGVDRRAAHAPARVEVEGVELGFLGYVDVPDDWSGYANRAWAATATSPGVAWADPAAIAEDVAALAPEVDHVVVLLHAGTEGSGEPDPTQVAAVRAALHAGASAVVGAHPHVLQGWSLNEGRLVAWSLGNTVFDGFEDPLSREAGLLVVTFTTEAVEEARLVPAVVDDRGLPRALDPDGEPGRAVLDRVDALPVPDLAGQDR